MVSNKCWRSMSQIDEVQEHWASINLGRPRTVFGCIRPIPHRRRRRQTIFAETDTWNMQVSGDRKWMYLSWRRRYELSQLVLNVKNGRMCVIVFLDGKMIHGYLVWSRYVSSTEKERIRWCLCVRYGIICPSVILLHNVKMMQAFRKVLERVVSKRKDSHVQSDLGTTIRGSGWRLAFWRSSHQSSFVYFDETTDESVMFAVATDIDAFVNVLMWGIKSNHVVSTG